MASYIANTSRTRRSLIKNLKSYPCLIMQSLVTFEKKSSQNSLIEGEKILCAK